MTISESEGVASLGTKRYYACAGAGWTWGVLYRTPAQSATLTGPLKITSDRLSICEYFLSTAAHID